jgi:hypothetical protein
MSKPFRTLFTLAAISIFCLSAVAPAFADDDEPISLAPVKKGSDKPEASTPVPTLAPTAAPTAAPAATAVPSPTVVPTAVPTPKPTPKPKPAKKLVHITDMNVSQSDTGLKVNVEAMGKLHGKVSVLKNPDRLLVSFPDAMLPGRKLAKDIGLGDLVRGRLAQHPDDSVWLVLDLVQPVKYSVAPSDGSGFSLILETGAKTEAPAAPRRIADLPKIDLMFFDVNVLFQGKQYDRFPCANFIYDKTDQFPLKREFVTTLVFHEGYGAFVGNLRIVDPKGNVLDHTKEPIAFNLFSELFDYSAEVPWKLEFPDKGFYSLILTLNGEDVMEHRFYVGHNDDKPEKPAAAAASN